MTRTTISATKAIAASLAAVVLGCSATALAQTAPTFEKKNYNYYFRLGAK